MNCSNCGYNLQKKAPSAAKPTTYTVCPRCGHKLKEPVTVGKHSEGDEGDPPRVIESLVESGN